MSGGAFCFYTTMIDTARHLLESLLIECNISAANSVRFAQIIVIALLLLLSYFIAWTFRTYAIPVILKIVEKTETKWDDYLINRPVLNATSQLFPCILVYILLPACYDNITTSITYTFISRFLQVYITVCGTLLFTAFLKNLSVALAEEYEEHHLTGISQFIRLIIICLGAIVSISLLFGYNPIRVIAGLGAAATVLMLIFKDSILGLVAGIQLSLNKMLKVGDWITIKKLDIDGIVEEISLTTVKVRNFDNTISTIPPYTLVSDAFQNWNAMVNSGARRIKRTLFIDVQSIRRLTSTEIDSLVADNLLCPKDITNKTDINLTLYRHYLSTLFKRDKDIVQNQWILVRQLNPTPNGIPLEVWLYTNNTNFIDYEEVAASRIERIIALLPTFHLRMFQSPTSADFQQLKP